jgi:hypothetical protein
MPITCGPRVWATGSSSENFGDDHAAGFSAALADALGQLNDRYIGWQAVIEYGALLGRGNSVKIDEYHVVIREPVGEIGWVPMVGEIGWVPPPPPPPPNP